MPTIPDWTALGSAPSGNSGRPVSSTKDFGDEISRTMLGNAAAAGESGKGLQALGAGLEKVGNAAIHIGQMQQERQDRLNNAKAEADLSGGLTGLKKKLSTEMDQNALRSSYPDQARGVLETVANNFSDPEARQLFIARHQPTINAFALDASERANSLYRNDYLAGLEQTREGLLKSFVAAKDNSERQRYLKQWKDFLDAASENGIIPADKAVKDMDAFTKGASVSFILAQPAERRLEMLGGVRPGEVAAKDLSPSDVALLNAIAGPESSGKYNVRYTPAGGAAFEGFSRHPGVKEVIRSGPNAGKTSDAAGRYQFLGSTWNDIAPKLGITDFSPESQDRVALYYAKDAYKKNTGRDLDADIKANGGLTEGMLDALSTAKGGPWEGFNSATGKAKALAAYKATAENKVDLENAREFISDPHAAALDPETHRELLHGAYRDYNLDTQQRYLDRKNAEATVNQKISDDWASVTATGQPTEGVTSEEVQRVFGPQRRAQFDRDRQIGMDYWAATHDFDSLSDGEIHQRLGMIDPRNHAGEGSKTWEKLYKSAAAKAKEIISLRDKDPASAADRLPEVAAVKEQVDLGGGVDATRALVKARMKAFEVMGIPAERRMPVTRQEAKDIIAPVEQALPGQEKAALGVVVKNIKETYGDDLTDDVLGFALKTAGVDQETSKIAARVLRQIGIGVKPSQSDVKAIGESKANDAMAAVAPRPSALASAAGPDYGDQSSPDAWAYQQDKAAASASKYPLPTDSDIRLLVQQPTETRVQQFDSIYGAGAATRVLNASSPTQGGK